MWAWMLGKHNNMKNTLTSLGGLQIVTEQRAGAGSWFCYQKTRTCPCFSYIKLKLPFCSLFLKAAYGVRISQISLEIIFTGKRESAFYDFFKSLFNSHTHLPYCTISGPAGNWHLILHSCSSFYQQWTWWIPTSLFSFALVYFFPSSWCLVCPW